MEGVSCRYHPEHKDQCPGEGVVQMVDVHGNQGPVCEDHRVPALERGDVIAYELKGAR